MSESEKFALCEQHPPCIPLILDFPKVMASPALQPNHVCGNTAIHSAVRWWERSGISVGAGDHYHRTNTVPTWPLPVGRKAIDHDVHDRRRVEPKSLSSLEYERWLAAAPFEHEERAALIVRLEVFGHLLEFFGFVEQDSQANTLLYRYSGSGFTLRAGGVDDPLWKYVVPLSADPRGIPVRVSDRRPRPLGGDMQKETDAAVRLLGQARRWWTSLTGKRLSSSQNAGRPRGQSVGDDRTADELKEWYIESYQRYLLNRHYLHLAGEKPPRQSDLAEWLGAVSKSTAKRRLRNLGVPWPPVPSRDIPEPMDLD
jgi:hypothetical protein